MNFTNGLIGCLLLLVGSVAYNTWTLSNSASEVAKRVSKFEEASHITMEQVDCQDKCPAYKYGQGQDNSDHEKCDAECLGATKQKFRTLLAK